MKITPDSAAALVTNVIGIFAIVFGMSQDTADVITKAVPMVVGGVMSVATVITYMKNKRKDRENVFNAMISAQFDGKFQAKGASDKVLTVAKQLGMV